MQNVLESVLATANQQGARRVCVIRLRVGSLSGVLPEALEFAFEALAKSAPLADADLEIEPVAALFRCAPCGQDFAADSLLGECPVCGAISQSLIQGRELQLTSMEIE